MAIISPWCSPVDLSAAACGGGPLRPSLPSGRRRTGREGQRSAERRPVPRRDGRRRTAREGRRRCRRPPQRRAGLPSRNRSSFAALSRSLTPLAQRSARRTSRARRSRFRTGCGRGACLDGAHRLGRRDAASVGPRGRPSPERRRPQAPATTLPVDPCTPQTHRPLSPPVPPPRPRRRSGRSRPRSGAGDRAASGCRRPCRAPCAAGRSHRGCPGRSASASASGCSSRR